MKITRIPRPLGTTLMAISLKTSTDKQKEIHKIKQHILNLYFINNQRINNTFYTIDQVAKYLQLSTMEILRYMANRIGYMQGFSEKDELQGQSELLRVLKFEAQKRALNGAQLAEYQADILLKSQGGKYKPWVTAEATRALGNLNQANKGIIDVIKALEPHPTSQTANFYSIDSTKQASDGSEPLTTEKALKLLSEANPNRLITDSSLKDNLKDQIGLNTLPEVRANYQIGVDTDNSLIPTTDTTAIIIDSKLKHAGRREKEFIDTDDI